MKENETQQKPIYIVAWISSWHQLITSKIFQRDINLEECQAFVQHF